MIFVQIRCFSFSVIIAIYNTGRYLNKSISSLLNQTVGIKKIQIILINDGSIDNSEEICFKFQELYKKNIIYLKTKNNGVSKARNIGMLLAKGKFINFLDPDDFWDYKAFKYVLSFFKNYKNINFVTGRIKFFEARNNFHPLDYKFFKTRIVNLTEEYNCIQSSSSTSFFKASYIDGRKFEEGIVSGEDTRFVNELLLINPIIGLIREAIYFCRKRKDFTSRTQKQRKDVEFYFSTIQKVSNYLLNLSKNLYNKIVPFIQFYLAYDILFRIETLSYLYLNSSNYIKYCNLIDILLQNIDDKYILEQKCIDNKFKMVALSKKYNKDLRYNIFFENGMLKYSDTILINLKGKNIIIWRILFIKDNRLHLEGVDNLWIPKVKYFYFCVYANKTFISKTITYSKNDFYSLFGLIDKGKIIAFDIPLKNIEKQTIYFYISFNNINFEIFPNLGNFINIPLIPSGYYKSENFIIKMIDKRMTLYKYNEKIEEYFELKYCNILRQLGKNNIIQLRNKTKNYRKKFKFNDYKNEIWIITDNKKKAGDNGEYFFRYLRTKRPKGVSVYFAIKKNCRDYKRLKVFGKIMDMDSFKYLNMFLKSDKLISSTCDLWIYNPLGRDQKYLRDLLNFDFIFLRSGIIKDDLSKSINWLSTKIDLFITSTKEEYNLLLSPDYGFSKNKIILTGLSRFDNLEKYKKLSKKKNNKILLVMPSWSSFIKSLINENIYLNNFKNIL